VSESTNNVAEFNRNGGVNRMIPC